MNVLYKIALIFIIIGAINWGMVGVFNINLVTLLFGKEAFMTNLIYALIGICGLLSIGILLKPDENTHQNIK